MSVWITWLGSLRLHGNLSARFLSLIFTKASKIFSAVASFPSMWSQQTRTSIQLSLAQWIFSFSVISIKACLNPSARAKSFHFTPMSSGNLLSWKSASFKVYFRSQPSWCEDATKKVKLLSKLGLKFRFFIFSTETENKLWCSCS